jgi:hypothetical protein
MADRVAEVTIRVRVRIRGAEAEDASDDDVVDVLRWHADSDDQPEDIARNQGIDVSAFHVLGMTRVRTPVPDPST